MSKFGLKSNKKSKVSAESFGRSYEIENEDDMENESSEGTNYDSDNGDDDDDEEEDDEVDVKQLPKIFYEFAITQLELNTLVSIQKAITALDKARTMLLEANPDLKTLLEKALKRKANDNKVPPGSGLVQRNIEDTRFQLCLINILKAKICVMQNTPLLVYAPLREALVWFPRSIEANYFSGELYRGQAKSVDDLVIAEQYYVKAVETMQLLQKNDTTSKSCGTGNMSVLQARLAANIQKHTNPNSADYSNGDDDEDDEDINSLTPEALLSNELCCGDKALQSLILLYCQSESKQNEAYKYLAQKGYTLKLSNEVLCYPLPSNTPSTTSPLMTMTKEERVERLRKSERYVSVLDDVVQSNVLNHLSHVFRPSSPFWSEHHYDTVCNASRTVGYFSYLYPMHTRKAVSSIEQIIDMIYPLVCAQFPQAIEATLAEWWVHSRPHINGHQLHFDSDETRLESGRTAQHPLVSCVLFVSADVGGPTLVTNQLISGDLATKGWLAYPQTNRLVSFDASYLHGVIPGRGLNPSLVSQYTQSTIGSSTAAGAEKDSRRLTFMIGFWKSISAKSRGVDTAGPGQDYPNLHETTYTWPHEMTLRDDFQSLSTSSSKIDVEGKDSLHRRVLPVEVNTVWESIETGVDESVVKQYSEEKGQCSGSSNSSNSKGKVSYDTCFQGF